MGLASIGIAGYRSIRSIDIPLRRLTLLVGSNGVGKTNLYRSLELLQAAAQGRLAQEIAREGGLASILYAGEMKKHEPRHLRLEATLDDILESGEELTYSVETAFPVSVQSAAFPTEAQIRKERLWLRGRRPVDLMLRDGPAVWARDDDGNRRLIDEQLLASETALANVRGTQREIDATRHVIAGWRFYHALRTDADSPLRKPGLAVPRQPSIRTAPIWRPSSRRCATSATRASISMRQSSWPSRAPASTYRSPSRRRRSR